MRNKGLIMRRRKGLSVVNLKNGLVAQLYDTVILACFNGDSIMLNSGGFRTKHTMNCINDLLPRGFSVFQRKSDWYVNTPSDVIAFTDGIKLNLFTGEEL